jgi:D-alanyl-D-alanine carboxypeptidase
MHFTEKSDSPESGNTPVRWFSQVIACLGLATCLFATPLAAESAGLPQQLDSLLSRTLSSSGGAVHSVILNVQAPARGFSYAAAAGQLQSGSDLPIAANDRFYIASISKTMTAVLVLQLAEQGLFSLDSKVAELGVFAPEVVAALHQIEGKSFGHEITIRQLLGHRSGMKDYLLDDRSGISNDFEAGLAPGSMAAIWMSQWQEFLDCQKSSTGCPAATLPALYPARPWIPWNAAAFQADPRNRDAGLLNFYLAEMADSALFEPGSGSHYSDTNFMILGLIIEQLTSSSLSEQLATGIFRPLGMHNSYLGDAAARASDSGSRLSDFWIGAVAFPGSGIDISWDWGGGGVVSSAADLNTFLQALVSGRLFQHSDTLQQMLEFQPVRMGGGVMQVGYGLGIRYALTEHGPRWGHSGAWGAKMEYFPELGLFVSGTVNAYGSGAEEALLNESARIIREHYQQQP